MEPSAVRLERVAWDLYTRASSLVELAVVRTRPRVLAAGLVVHDVDGASVPGFDPSKTIADLFKYRSRAGLDVALEALRAYVGSAHRDLEALRRPVLLAEIAPGSFNLFDGHDRLEKARRHAIVTLWAHRLTAAQHLRFLTSTRAYLAFVAYWNGKVANAR